ncbi:hypothetical protein LUW77_09020 [Streptomyces radiopugnans]|nr:hypothetical protein LUW77_09020 [Streptomyces radiopugnans]
MADTPICPICHRPADDSGRASCRCAEVEVLPRPVAQPDRGPDPADLAMFTEGARRADGDTAPLPLVTGGRPAPRRRIGRGLALAVGGTAVAVVGSGVLVAGLFTRGDDTFDEARFGDRGGAPTAVVPTDGKGEESAGADDSASPSTSPSTTASPSPSASASPSQSRTPSSSPPPPVPPRRPRAPPPRRPPAPTTPDWDDRDGGWDGDGDGDGLAAHTARGRLGAGGRRTAVPAGLGGHLRRPGARLGRRVRRRGHRRGVHVPDLVRSAGGPGGRLRAAHPAGPGEGHAEKLTPGGVA